MANTELNCPEGVAADTAGNVYVASSGYNAIQRFAPNGSGGYKLTPDVANGLKGPKGVAVDSFGDVYIADTSNNRILKAELQSLCGGLPNYHRHLSEPF